MATKNPTFPDNEKEIPTLFFIAAQNQTKKTADLKHTSTHPNKLGWVYNPIEK